MINFTHRIFLLVFYRGLMRPFLKFFVGVDFFTESNPFDKSEQFIIVANHNSHIDTMAIMSTLKYRNIKNVHPVAALDYFGKSFFHRVLSRLFVNILLIDRVKGREENSPIDVMLGVLDKGESLVIFPEGSRGMPGVMQTFKIGVAILLKKRPDIPFLPVKLKGVERSLPKGDGLLVPFSSSLILGELQYIDPDMNEDEILELIKNKIVCL